MLVNDVKYFHSGANFFSVRHWLAFWFSHSTWRYLKDMQTSGVIQGLPSLTTWFDLGVKQCQVSGRTASKRSFPPKQFCGSQHASAHPITVPGICDQTGDFVPRWFQKELRKNKSSCAAHLQVADTSSSPGEIKQAGSKTQVLHSNLTHC